MDANDPRRGTRRYKVATNLINKTIETIGPAVFDVLGEGSDERLTDAFFEVLGTATGEGPFTLDAAEKLNEIHALAEMEGFYYSVDAGNRMLTAYIDTPSEVEFVQNIPLDGEVPTDALYQALKANLDAYTAQFPKQ